LLGSPVLATRHLKELKWLEQSPTPKASPTRPSTSCSRDLVEIRAGDLRGQARPADHAYYSQLGEGLLEYVGPLVETTPQEKALSIAMREINAGLLTSEPSTRAELQCPLPAARARLERSVQTWSSVSAGASRHTRPASCFAC
jgi:DNA-directed RNA polymerase omega subunit